MSEKFQSELFFVDPLIDGFDGVRPKENNVEIMALSAAQARHWAHLREHDEIAVVVPAQEAAGEGSVKVIEGKVEQVRVVLRALARERRRAREGTSEDKTVGPESGYAEAQKGREGNETMTRKRGRAGEELPLDRFGILDVVAYARQSGTDTEHPLRRGRRGRIPALGRIKAD